MTEADEPAGMPTSPHTQQDVSTGVPVGEGASTPETPQEALGDTAPPSNVVALNGRGKRQPKASASTNEAESPPSPDSASAPSQGNGGEKAGGRAKRKIDWGRFTYLLENFVLIYPTDTVWDHSKRKQVKISNMAHMYGTDYVRMWKASPDRKTIDEEDLVFDPTMTCGPEKINLYRGLAIEPIPATEADVAPMLDLLYHLCGRCQGDEAGIEAVMQWVLRWLALPLQRPGAKPRSALVFHGPQGTGKNLFFDVVRGMYGEYGIMVGQTEIEDKFNGWLSAKQLVIGNEVVSRQELYHSKNRLKWVITEETIPIRTMHTDSRSERNHANVVFLSNERQPLVLEQGDRRYLVVYTPVPEDGVLYARVRDFLANDGPAKWLHFLLHYDLGDFHEHTKPLMTEAKQDLIDLSMRSDERFMSEWIGGFLHLPMRPCSAEQLYRAFRRWCDASGERYPPAQHAFTMAARRWVAERVERDAQGERLEPCLDYKVTTLPADPLTSSGRRSIRCWLPRGTGPLNGVSEGAWVAECVDAFETALGRFLRSHEGAEDAPEPKSGGSKS